MSPRFPSCIRSRNERPLLRYLRAMLTTSLRFDSQSFFLASSSPCSILMASSRSSSAVSRGTLPISLKYILTGSSVGIFFAESLTSISPDDLMITPLFFSSSSSLSRSSSSSSSSRISSSSTSSSSSSLAFGSLVSMILTFLLSTIS